MKYSTTGTSFACTVESAAATAASAFTMPFPQLVIVHFDDGGKGFFVDWMIERTSCGESCGATPSIRLATPDTIGAAKLVPPPAPIAYAPATVLPVFHST